MNVAVIGIGYVGIATAVTLGELGHRVIGVDTNEDKIRLLGQGKLPIHEQGIEPLLQTLLKAGRIQFTMSLAEAMEEAEILFIAVGTPSLPNGRADLSYVEEVYREVGRIIHSYKIIVNKSTVPVGTADWAKSLLQEEIARRNVTVPFDIVSNPEFLQEGKALENARKPERIVIGCTSETAKERIQQLYRSVSAPVLITTPRNAEMIKYASNAYLALKISYINELARLCEMTNVDIVEVAKGMGLDPRIGPFFLQAGIGYGGSCFPKDVAALYQLGQEYQQEMTLLRDTTKINEDQIDWFINRIEENMRGLTGKRIAMYGLSFKPDTDDLREAPSLRLIDVLLQRGVSLTAYDPVMKEKMFDKAPNLSLAKTPYEAAQKADAILLCTEWKEFSELDWGEVKRQMNGDFIFDGRNILPAKKLISLGFQYRGVGRKVD